jgi:dTDP-4-dehydrorhamnose 3,5-epimerase-like enzyme
VITDVNQNSPRIGNIVGVNVWPMTTNVDSRGRLFKASTEADSDVFPMPFSTFEHFFTESKEYVFRGMHFQGYPHEVSKVISIVQGKAIDFLFDMREKSPTCGNLQIVELNEVEPKSIFIPTGVAHGYLALEEKTIISYRMDGPFCVKCDSGFSAEIVSSFLPIHLSETIQSKRDTELPKYENFKFLSECKLEEIPKRT